MPASHVQELLGGGQFVNDDTLVITGSKTVTAGNDIFVFIVQDWPIVVASVTDNLGNDYDIVTRTTYGLGAPGMQLEVWWAADVLGGTLTQQTVTLSGAVTNWAAFSSEFADVPDIFVGDESDFLFNDTNPQAIDNGGGGLHFFVVGTKDAGDDAVFTPPAGYTYMTFARAGTGSGPASRRVDAAYLIGSSSGLLTGSFADAHPTMDWMTLTTSTDTPVPPGATAGVSFDGLTLRVAAEEVPSS